MKNFKGLSDKQLRVFEQIAINNDAAHNERTLDSLVKRGLKKKKKQTITGGFIWRYDVPLLVHLEWCEWCAEN